MPPSRQVTCARGPWLRILAATHRFRAPLAFKVGLSRATWCPVRRGGLSEACFSVVELPLAGNGGLFVCFRQPVDARSSRHKLEAEWHQRLKRARSRYEGRVAIRKEMLAERSERPISLQPDPDGRFALHLALQEETTARTEYMRVLNIFLNLILHGTPPEVGLGS